MTLLDTNVLVYAANRDCEFYELANQLIGKAISGQIAASISLQILIEFYSVITSPKRVEKPLSPEDAVNEINKYIESEKIWKIQFNENALKILSNLAKKYNVIAQDIYDLKIVATMLANGVIEIITANENDFCKYSEIKVNNPFNEAT